MPAAKMNSILGARSVGTLRSFRAGGQDANHAHHAVVGVFEKMAVIYEVTDNVGIAEIQADAHAGIDEGAAVVIRDVYGVPKKRFVHRPAEIIEQHEMKLVDVEGVEFAGAIFDDPIFDRALAGHDIGDSGARIEGLGLLALDRDVKLSSAIRVFGIEQFF